MKNLGLRILLAALLVNGPRFVLTFLVADSLQVPVWIEATILALTGIATGVVLTGGGAYIAHELIAMTGHFWARLFMGICWIILLVSTVVILAPLMAVALAESDLSVALNTPEMRWWWSIVAVVAVEVLAAGAMVAHAVNAQPVTQTERKNSNFGLIANALAHRIASQLQPAEVATVQLPSAETAIQPQLPEVQPAKPIEIPPQATEALGMQDNGMTIAEIATQLRKSERTISNYLKQAKERRAIVHANGSH